MFQYEISARLLDARKSLEWWNVVPVGRTLQIQEIESFRSRLEVVPASSQRLPCPSHDLGFRLVKSRGNISISDFVSTSIYLLSNRLHDFLDGDRGLQILCSLFEHDTQLFAQLLQCERSTGKATWESLLEYSQYQQRTPVFEFLLHIGLRYSWLDPSNTRVLVSALATDFPTSITGSIVNDLRPDGNDEHPWREILDAISISYSKGHLEIAKTLVETFDINAPVFKPPIWPETPVRRYQKRRRPASVFFDFILSFDSTKIANWRLLDFLLSSGADVDRALPSQWYAQEPSRRWYEKNALNRALRPTILDHSFCLDRSLFERLFQHSKASTSKLTKTGLLLSLEKGSDDFQDYLGTRVLATHPSDWKVIRSALDVVLLDHFDVARWNVVGPREDRYPYASNCVQTKMPEINLKVARSYIQYCVDPDIQSHSSPVVHTILGGVLRQLREQFTDQSLQVLDILVQKGVDITEEHFEHAAEKNGTWFLEWLRPMVKNFPIKAPRALAKAASLNNFEAVEYLLQAGADLNAFINSMDETMEPRDFVIRNMTGAAVEQFYSVQAIAAGVGTTPNCSVYSSLKMIQLLAERGSEFVVSPTDLTDFDFLILLLEHGAASPSSRGDTELFDKVKFVFRTLKQGKQWSIPPAYLLELCVSYPNDRSMEDIDQRLRIFEYLLDGGVGVNPGSPLAALTRFGAHINLVKRVLDSGARLDAYTAVSYRYPKKGPMATPLQAAAHQANQELVELLLDRGADVNCPARGACGCTALQAICEWDPATEEEHRRKMKICELLLSSGAEVNAAPTLRFGMTALQAAARKGDIKLTAILIQNGAHVNAPPSKFGPQLSALDWAARFGRLDVSKLLLEANALSHTRGMTGYDGAINEARRFRRHAVANLIREYLVHITENGLNGPGFQHVAEDYHVHGYNADDESADDVSWKQWELYREPTECPSSDGEASDCDTAEYGLAISSTSPMGLAQTDVPEAGEGVPTMHRLGNTLTDDFMGHMGTQLDSTVGDLNLGWDNELMPDHFMGTLTDFPGAQGISDQQLSANARIDEWVSHTDIDSGPPQEHMGLAGNEWISQNPFDIWAGMPDCSPFWQQWSEDARHLT